MHSSIEAWPTVDTRSQSNCPALTVSPLGVEDVITSYRDESSRSQFTDTYCE